MLPKAHNAKPLTYWLSLAMSFLIEFVTSLKLLGNQQEALKAVPAEQMPIEHNVFEEKISTSNYCRFWNMPYVHPNVETNGRHWNNYITSQWFPHPIGTPKQPLELWKLRDRCLSWSWRPIYKHDAQMFVFCH